MTKCEDCIYCGECYDENDVLPFDTNCKHFIKSIKTNYEKCKTCIHCGVCIDNEVLGICNGKNYISLKEFADYNTALTFLPTPYPKEFRGTFDKGYNTAIQECLLRIRQYYKE